MEQRSGIEQALALYGDSPTKLAKALGEKVLRQHIEHWLRTKKVPADRAPDVERVTGIRCELLCPDVNWAVVRGTEGSPLPESPATTAEQGA